MRKRFRPTPEADSLVVLDIVDQIKNIDRVAPPTAAELAARQERDRERERRRRERDRIAAAEREQAEREEAAEQERLAQEQRRAARIAAAEQAKAAMAEQQKQRQAADDRRKLSGIVQEWTGFKANIQQAWVEQQHEIRFQEMQRTIDTVTRMINPPPDPEPLPDYAPPDAPSPRLGDPNWDVVEMGRKALRWR